MIQFRGRNTSRTRESGFTLLEMSIVLVIVGVIIGIAAPIVGDLARKSREAGTTANLDLVQDALAVFVQRNGRLPCPAAPNGVPFGDERATCSTAATADGIIPFRTLGLTESQVYDGYNNAITYSVAWNATTTSSASEFCGVTGTGQANTLTLVDENAAALTTDIVAYSLVSHGTNASSSYIATTGNRNAASGSAFEAENADADGVFVDTGTIDEDATNGPFDDRLRWVTRDDMGALLRDEGCDGDTDTAANLDVLGDALGRFLRDNGRLPCPAAPNGSPLGIERASCTSNATLEGVVPFRTLGVTESAALDGYGRYLTYRVAENYPALATSDNLADYCAVDPDDGDSSLLVVDTGGTAVTSSAITVAIVSHGDNSFGFYQVPANSRFSASSGDAFEDENADGDIGFVDDTKIDGGYDDVVSWWTRDGLALIANPLDGCELGLDEITEDNMNQVEAAIAVFLQRNGRIPCPARPQDDSPLGVEYTTGSCNGNDEVGIVPFRTLGLPLELAQDGYGRLMTYHVTFEYTETADLADFCAETESGEIEVEDENGDDVVDDYSATPLVYVLISHGANGFGHYVAGSSNPVNDTAGTAWEDENADEDGDFVDAPFQETDDESNIGYDDLTRWRTRDIIAGLAGGCP